MLAIYRKHARLMVLLLVFSCLVGLAYYVYARPFYYVKARAQVGSFPGSPTVDDQMRESQVRGVLRELNSAAMIERTARRMGLKGSARELQLRNLLNQSIHASTDGAIEIECWSASAELGRNWPAALISEFQGHQQQGRARDLYEIVRGYSDELQEAAAKLGRKIELTDPNDVMGLLGNLRQLETSPTELAQVIQRLDRFGQVRIQLENSSLDTAAKLALLSALNESVKNAPGEQIQPIPHAAQPSADQLGAQFQQARRGFESEYEALLKKKAELEKLASPATTREGAAARPTLEASRMTRRPLPQVAAELQSKINQLEDQWKSEADLTLPRTAETRGRRVFASPGKLLLLSLLLGVALASGVPLLLARLDRSIARPEQIESLLGLRVLGSVPKITLPARTRGGTAKELVSFRPIAASLLALDSAGSRAQVFMVSSALRGEGKTSAVSNLAMCLADLGEKTVVIDCDLGRSRIHRRFGYRRSPGLSDILRRERRFEEACRVTAHHDLSILPVGQPVDNGPELLGSEAFTGLIRRLRETYDCVLLDTPPVLGFSETSILQKQVDGVVLVIRSGVTPRTNVKAAMEMLEVNGANFFGAVLNGVDDGVHVSDSPRADSSSSRPAVQQA